MPGVKTDVVHLIQDQDDVYTDITSPKVTVTRCVEDGPLHLRKNQKNSCWRHAFVLAGLLLLLFFLMASAFLIAGLSTRKQVEDEPVQSETIIVEGEVIIETPSDKSELYATIEDYLGAYNYEDGSSDYSSEEYEVDVDYEDDYDYTGWDDMMDYEYPWNDEDYEWDYEDDYDSEEYDEEEEDYSDEYVDWYDNYDYYEDSFEDSYEDSYEDNYEDSYEDNYDDTYEDVYDWDRDYYDWLNTDVYEYADKDDHW